MPALRGLQQYGTKSAPKKRKLPAWAVTLLAVAAIVAIWLVTGAHW